MSTCARCGAGFSCGMVDAAGSDAPCWCTALPPVLPVPSDAVQACYCPACLAAVIASQQPAQG
ncbi:MAG TPA: cysteine-rich CWC family protein [Burkholderiaceae bacterium]